MYKTKRKRLICILVETRCHIIWDKIFSFHETFVDRRFILIENISPRPFTKRTWKVKISTKIRGHSKRYFDVGKIISLRRYLPEKFTFWLCKLEFPTRVSKLRHHQKRSRGLTFSACQGNDIDKIAGGPVLTLALDTTMETRRKTCCY